MPAFEQLDYYQLTAPMTDPGDYSSLFTSLPQDLPGLCSSIQSLLIHIYWAERYGLQLSKERQQEVQIRPVKRKLERILELDSEPLSTPRPPEKRLVSNCRDISTFLCSVLRWQHIPARARCGFGTYFFPGHFEDHWMVEYWDASNQHWVAVDAQLDELQKQALKISFNPLDLPEGAFITGGKAWLNCRQGKTDPDAYGIFNMHGWDFIRGNVIRDFLALNKIEVLPWDFVPYLQKPYEQLSAEELTWLDQLSTWTLSVDNSFNELRATYENTASLQVPADWWS